MSFFKNIKKVLGLGSDDYDAEEVVEVTSVDNEQVAEQLPTHQVMPSEIDVDKTMVQAIFCRVIEVFNTALPDFLQKSADPEKQRQYLYDSLDASVKQYLESLKLASQEACQNAWENDKAQMRKQMEALQKRATELEEKKSKISERQLSADRQKRALQERVHDLEEQVLALEAEKEQYQLEAHSLLNKIKVAGVHEADMEELLAENQHLKAQIEENIDPNTKEWKERATVAEKKVEELETELTKIKESIETAKVKNQMADQMVNEMRSKLATQVETAKHLEEQLVAFKAEAAMHLEEQLNIVRAEAAKQLQEQIEATRLEAAKDADEQTATKEEIQAIMSQISRFEEVKAKMNGRIESLKANLKESQKVIESLRNTIQSNLLEHAKEQKALLAQIEDLKAQQKQVNMTLIEDHQRYSSENQKEEDNVEIDDPLLSGDDWLVSKPDKESTMRPPADEVEFGYQPPSKKQRASENKSQMTLFD